MPTHLLPVRGINGRSQHVSPEAVEWQDSACSPKSSSTPAADAKEFGVDFGDGIRGIRFDAERELMVHHVGLKSRR
jgi:hypothetical protein